MNNEDLFRLENICKRILAEVQRPPRLAYTMDETCKAIGISEPTLRDWIKQGRIAGTRTNGKGAWLFPVKAVEAALAWKVEAANV